VSLDSRLTRLDANRLQVENECDIDCVLFANQNVPVETAAVTELVELLKLQKTVERFAEASPESFDVSPAVTQVAITPDFHKARGIPVGTVMETRGFIVPQAIGNDINCGMRLHLTEYKADQIANRIDDLETTCRRMYFEGGRNIPMSRVQREALFKGGLEGLVNAVPKTQTEGLWGLFHDLAVAEQLDRVEHRGTMKSGRTIGLNDFLGPPDRMSRDTQIGSIGGGNHFVEIQRVEKIHDGAVAHAWGLKRGMVTVMVHTGSVSVGHLCGGLYRDKVREVYPAGLQHPENGVFLLPDAAVHAETASVFWDCLSNAANFAFANRMFLAVMALECLRRVVGDCGSSLLYDAPHNLVWQEIRDGEKVVIHRKGACPARGYEAMANTPFSHEGEPVLVPGSMGANSFILVGQGNAEALCSASHGAGRVLSRGDAMKGHDAEFQAFLDAFRIVTPVDLRRPDIRMRKDILSAKLAEMKQEAPFAFKGIGAVVETLTDSGIARPVAEVAPLMTIKG
jgi:tRNA-splicing ligase RtcB